MITDKEAAFEAFDILQHEHHKRGVGWRMSIFEGGEYLYFSSFSRHLSGSSQPGDGENALVEVLRLADKLNTPVVLGTYIEKLECLYRRHGFVRTHKGFGVSMARRPQ